MKKGFTLVELVIVIIIVGILSLVAVPIYQKYVLRAKLTEGLTTARALADAAELYILETGTASGVTTGPYSTLLGIDLRGNKYFRNISMSASINPTNPNEYGITITLTPYGNTD